MPSAPPLHLHNGNIFSFVFIKSYLILKLDRILIVLSSSFFNSFYSFLQIFSINQFYLIFFIRFFFFFCYYSCSNLFYCIYYQCICTYCNCFDGFRIWSLCRLNALFFVAWIVCSGGYAQSRFVFYCSFWIEGWHFRKATELENTDLKQPLYFGSIPSSLDLILRNEIFPFLPASQVEFTLVALATFPIFSSF